MLPSSADLRIAMPSFNINFLHSQDQQVLDAIIPLKFSADNAILLQVKLSATHFVTKLRILRRFVAPSRKLSCIVWIIGVELVGSVVIVTTSGIVRTSCIVWIVGVQLVGVIVIMTIGTSS